MSLQDYIAEYSSRGECSGGKLLQYIRKNDECSIDCCRFIIQQSKESKLDPLLKQLSVNSDIQEIIRVIKDIKNDFKVRGKGPAKNRILQEFNEVFHEAIYYYNIYNYILYITLAI